jgi:hypothetical protein
MAYVTDRKRVTGLGAAKSGTHHFWTMTVTAVALFVLTPFFLGVIGPLLGAPHEEVIASLSRPVPAAIVAAYLVVGMHHFKLGVTADRGLRARARPQDLDHRDDDRQLRHRRGGAGRAGSDRAVRGTITR